MHWKTFSQTFLTSLLLIYIYIYNDIVDKKIHAKTVYNRPISLYHDELELVKNLELFLNFDKNKYFH
jgi:hypothetical protein